MPRYWWVNQNQTYKAEVGGGYMWSPKVNKNGSFSQFYKNMTEVTPGDLVFSFEDRLIKTVGVVSAPARSAEKPKEFGKAGDAWDVEGWLVHVDYEELVSPVKPKDHMDVLKPLLPQKYSPIRANGDGNQVYLTEIPVPMAEVLLSLIGRQLIVSIDEGQARAIQNRTDIGVTEKYQLVLSRVGQGQYRKNLEQHEVGCRVTGVTDGRFLTASHIKPWSKSNDFEKIDGNNGLLLSPHVDRLFDRGYISFEDNGDIILDPSLPVEVISVWGLLKAIEKRRLSAKQAVYMSYHRNKILRKNRNEVKSI
ncbi:MULTISPECIES: HNH endonuclease [unclassified Ruegeria]|uniref:HNH endonuclease n=1 Tax=unclassified Ruegeria TaxID=2625375 RepID=UPI00148A0516|nr:MULTISPECIES: HNH endonuclease [unclassified Ruegeria]